MSVAYDLYPLAIPTDDSVVALPGTVRPLARPGVPPLGDRVAPVVVLRAPAASALAAPLRLTRRGVVVLALAVVAIGVALVWAAALSAPSAHAAPTSGAATVTVRAGDTLWGIASRVAPGVDPRAEVAQLSRLNHLTDSSVVPGQTLRLR